MSLCLRGKSSLLRGRGEAEKTTLLHQIIKNLLVKTDKNNICYINLDDSRLGYDLEKIYDAYLELSDPKGTFIFS